MQKRCWLWRAKRHGQRFWSRLLLYQCCGNEEKILQEKKRLFMLGNWELCGAETFYHFCGSHSNRADTETVEWGIDHGSLIQLLIRLSTVSGSARAEWRLSQIILWEGRLSTPGLKKTCSRTDRSKVSVRVVRQFGRQKRNIHRSQQVIFWNFILRSFYRAYGAGMSAATIAANMHKMATLSCASVFLLLKSIAEQSKLMFAGRGI